jgi:hypothetical protein
MAREVYKDSQSAGNCLRNNGIDIDDEGKVITIPKDTIVGNKLWGAIDYLKNFHKYIWVRG